MSADGDIVTPGVNGQRMWRQRAMSADEINFVFVRMIFMNLYFMTFN